MARTSANLFALLVMKLSVLGRGVSAAIFTTRPIYGYKYMYAQFAVTEIYKPTLEKG